MNNISKLTLKEIAESVIKHIRNLHTGNVFGKLDVKIENGKPQQVKVEESIYAKHVK